MLQQLFSVPKCDGRLSHFCHKFNVYGKEQPPQGNHLRQRQGGGIICDYFVILRRNG